MRHGQRCQTHTKLAFTSIGESPFNRSANIADPFTFSYLGGRPNQRRAQVVALCYIPFRGLPLITSAKLCNEILGELARDGVELARLHQLLPCVGARRIQEAQIPLTIRYG